MRIILTAAILGLLIQPANSEPWKNGSAVLRCDAEVGTFELKSEQNNVPIGPGQPQPASDVYFPSDLERTPFQCQLENHTIFVEGWNTIDGKGPCGAKAGALARVIINGKPVAFDFRDKASPRSPSVSRLASGWIELSSCFEAQQSINVSVSSDGLSVTLCRTELPEQFENSIIQQMKLCKIWHADDSTFARQETE